MVVGSISSGGDHDVHCWWDPIRSKQLFSVPYVTCRCLPGFLVMIIYKIYMLLENNISLFNEECCQIKMSLIYFSISLRRDRLVLCIFIRCGRAMFQIRRGLIGLFVCLDACWIFSQSYFQGTEDQINIDLLSGLFVCIGLCGSQIFILSRPSDYTSNKIQITNKIVFLWRNLHLSWSHNRSIAWLILDCSGWLVGWLVGFHGI